MQNIKTPFYTLDVGGADALLRYTANGRTFVLAGPVFEVDGAPLTPDFSTVELVSE